MLEKKAAGANYVEADSGMDHLSLPVGPETAPEVRDWVKEVVMTAASTGLQECL